MVSKFIRKKWKHLSTTRAEVLVYELTGKYHAELSDERSQNLKEILQNEIAKLEQLGLRRDQFLIKSDASSIPRYVRINTLLIEFKDVLKQMKNDGWMVRRLKAGISPSKYRDLVTKLERPKFYIDPHIDNLLIFPQGTNFNDNNLYKRGALILQDKASCFSAALLNPEPGSDCLDACAAPGMKTTHLSAIMQNKGSIWAFDRNKERMQLLRGILKKSGANNVHTECIDFLKVDLEKFKKVKYALVDPPCSGSGMAKRGEFLDEFEQFDKQRIQSLSNLQCMILKHAFRLPNLQRLLYSTCSMHWQENEGVILEVLSDPMIGECFELIDPLSVWKHRGRDSNSQPESSIQNDEERQEMLRKCLRASPKRDLTNGFFIALFQRK